MAFVHGKNTYVSLAGYDISPYSDNTEWERESDEHEVTTYGKNDHVVQGGLGGGKVTVSGTYDNTMGGPRAVLEVLEGQNATFVFRPEGTGVGKPQRSVNVLVKGYKETAAVADMVKWSVDLTMSDAVTRTTQ